MGYPIFHSQYTAAQIEASIGKSPRVNESSRWEVWDIAVGAYVDTGVSADAQEAATRAEAAAVAAQGSAGDADASATAASGSASAAEAAAASLVFDQYPMFESDHAVTSNGIAFTLAAHDGIQAANLAQPFSTSVNYLAGDYCTYDSGEAFSRALYRFTRNKAAGAWDATAVERVALADELSDGLAEKQDTLTFDDEPTADSTNPVTSKGIKTYVDDGLAEKLNLDGYSALATVGNAEQLVSTVRVTDQVPYIFRTSGGSADIGNREYDTVVGGSLPWNQLVDTSDTSVTMTLGHKYLAKISDVWSMGASDGSAITVDGSANDMVFDLTQMFGSAVADHIYALEQANVGDGVAWFRALFPKPYYAYNAGELLSVSGLQSHDMTGFNQWDEEWEVGSINNDTGAPMSDNANIRAKNFNRCLPNATYYFSADGRGRETRYYFYDADKNFIGGGQTTATGRVVRTPANTAYFKCRSTSSYGATYKHDICINLSWSGYRNGEYEPYQLNSYPLDSSLTLRGIPKLDADGNLYYDGDSYAADGTVTRRYAERPYESGDESLDNAITDGTTTVYLLATPTTETADPFQSPQIVDDFGTERYVVAEQGGVAVPVGHRTEYPANLRDKLQHLPDLANNDGTYAIRQTGASMALIPVTTPTELPAAPSEDGTYTLKVTVASGEATYSWEVDA